MLSIDYKIGDMLEAERRGWSLEGVGNRNLFDHTYKLNLRTYKSPISLDNQNTTVPILTSLKYGRVVSLQQ